MLWEEHDVPLPDIDAIHRAIGAIRHGHGAGEAAPEPMDLAAVLVLLQAARLDLDRLEVELIEAVLEAGIDWPAIAAVLDLPDADSARRRHEKLRPRKNVPVDEVDPPAVG